MARALSQERGRHHHDVGAREQFLGDVRARVDSGACRQGNLGAQLGSEDRDPTEREPQFPRLAQLEAVDHTKGLEVQVRLVEAVEQNESVRAASNGLAREIGERRVVRAELDGQRDGDGRANLRDEVQVRRIHLRRGLRRVRRDAVQVEFQRVRSGFLHELGVANPAAGRGGVEACDDRHGGRGLDRGQIGQIAVPDARQRIHCREVLEGFRELAGAGFERLVQPDLVVEDLLLEQRREHDGPHARLVEATGGGGIAGQRRGRSHDRRAEFETEIPGA